MGCFEVTTQYLSTHAPITVPYHPPKQAWLQTMIEAGRAHAQLHIAADDPPGARARLKVLKRAEAVGMLPDKACEVGEGRWIGFLGRPAYTMTLATRQNASDATAIMMWAERLPNRAGYHVHLQAPTQAIVGDTEQRAQIIRDEIAHLIRQRPEQY